jgi:hypothetical protein
MDNLYKEVLFLNGDKCQVIKPTVIEISRAFKKYNQQCNDDDALDMYPFLMEQFCLFNGIKKELNFILKLNSDVYFQLLPVLAELINPPTL